MQIGTPQKKREFPNENKWAWPKKRITIYDSNPLTTNQKKETQRERGGERKRDGRSFGYAILLFRFEWVSDGIFAQNPFVCILISCYSTIEPEGVGFGSSCFIWLEPLWMCVFWFVCVRVFFSALSGTRPFGYGIHCFWLAITISSVWRNA